MNPQAKQYILDRLKEPSTWRGIIATLTSLLTIFGVIIELTPAQIQSIIAVGVGAAGFVGMLSKDAKPND